jgi:hypothetical protein
VKVIAKTLAIAMIMVYLLAAFGCGGPTKKVETVPQPTEPPKEPSIEELRKPVAKDDTIYKAVEVLQKFGRLTKKYMSYEKYQSTVGAQATGAIDPDWFYDSYVLDMNENGYWATVTFGTAKKAKENDSRLRDLMENLPGQSIFIKLKTPSGKTYLLSDAEADGVLDFAKDTGDMGAAKIDIQLLDQMQEKYTWLIGIIKKYYKK